MRTILINRREIETAIRNPRAGKIMFVTRALRTHQADQVIRGKNGTVLLHCRSGWTSDFITVYKEI